MTTWIRRQQAWIAGRLGGHISTQDLLAFHDGQDGANRRLHAGHLAHCRHCARELACVREVLSQVSSRHREEAQPASLQQGRRRILDAMAGWNSGIPGTARATEELGVYLGESAAAQAQPADLAARIEAFLGARTAAELRSQLLQPTHSAQ